MRYFLTVSIIFFFNQYIYLTGHIPAAPSRSFCGNLSFFSSSTFPFSASDAPSGAANEGGRRSQTQVSGPAAASPVQSQL